MWLIYSLLAALLWGVGQVILKKGTKNISALFSNVYTSILGFIIFVPFALSHGVNFGLISQIAPFTIIVAFLLQSYYYAIGRGQLSLTGTIVGAYPLVTVILSLLFLHETPSIFQKIAIISMITGTVLIALPTNLTELKKIKLGSWLIWALAALFMIGTSDFLVKVLMNKSDLYTYLFTYAFSSLAAITVLVFLDKKGRKLPPFSKKLYLSTLIGAGMIEIGFFIFHLAIADGYISLVSPISSVYVAITAVLAWLILKEKINKIQFLGIALSTLGIVLIGIN